MSILTFDHLAVTGPDLAAGAAWVEAALGQSLVPGGKHPLMGTHNQLLSLGPDEYLEVITPDPEASAPGRARWFGLDQVSGPPQLSNWALRCADIDAALARMPAGAGRPLPQRRGDLRWRMAVPDDGLLPFDGLCPALIQWDGPHPAPHMPGSGCTLTRLQLRHPQVTALEQILRPLLDDARIQFETAPEPALVAWIDTPAGLMQLGA